ncbi:MAG TPA: patatin-like phospholipase family protein [Candidatus Dormibacteraeota bacterium]
MHQTVTARRERTRQAQRRPRVGIVLGAGGVLGGAWMAGALVALMRITGWDPSEADCLVGTSAGAVFAALLAAGVSPSRLLPSGPTDASWILNELTLESTYRSGRWLPHAPMGSWRLALAGVLQSPSPWSMLQTLSGIAPTGRVSPDPIARTVRQIVAHGWAAHPHCRIVATDYASGKRVVFGDAGAPDASLAEAVSASCAIPGFFEPVAINGRRYVDGGLHSLCNLDLLDAADLDVVICFSALTSHLGEVPAAPLQRAFHTLFGLAVEQLDRQVRALTDRGVDVVVVEPTVKDKAAMGVNLMDARRWGVVLEIALSSVARELQRCHVRRRLRPLVIAA